VPSFANCGRYSYHIAPRGSDIWTYTYRETGALNALDPASLAAILEPARNDGSFAPEHLRTLRRLGALRKVVLLAFPPKAAGTFLRVAIIRAIDGQLVRVVYAQGGRDATPYLPTFVHYFNGGVTDKTLVGHVHMLALPANLHFLEAFGIRPIVIKRSIPDMLASYWDMLERDDGAMLEGLNCAIPASFRTMSRDDKADFMVDILGPWYVKYYAGWLEFAQSSPDGVCLIDYRSVKNDAVGVLRRCLDHLGIPRSREECQMAVLQSWNDRHELRFNKGEEGRGAEYFSQAQLQRLSRMIGHYPVLAGHHGDLLETRPATP
jgi:hypothetical protein